MIAEIKRMRFLLSMPRAEVVSRANAWDEVKAAGHDLIRACHEGGEATSPEVAAIAGSVLGTLPAGGNVTVDDFNHLLEAAKTLAGSALTQYPGGDDKLPEEAGAARALVDAQTHGQADPIVKTVVIKAPYGVKADGVTPKELKDLD